MNRCLPNVDNSAEQGWGIFFLAYTSSARAFRGELVPAEAELARRESRSYEPASALLARVMADHPEKGINLRSQPRPKGLDKKYQLIP